MNTDFRILARDGAARCFAIFVLRLYNPPPMSEGRTIESESSAIPSEPPKGALAALVAPVQILAGDAHGLDTLEHQPAKVMAMEGHYQSHPAGAPLKPA